MPAPLDVTHPDLQRLRDFVVGKLDNDLADQIAEHLEVCDACTTRLETEASVDSFVDLVCHAERDRTAESARNRTVPTATVLSRPTPLNAPSPNVPSVSIEGYEILEELGRGGMGVVYRANHLGLKRQVALKVILAGAHSSEAERERFRREAETIARLHHPGIVQIYEIDEHDGRLYVVLELIDGISLRQAMNGHPQEGQWSAEIVMKLARTMQYSHQEGVIHRDLKPENVLLPFFADHASAVVASETNTEEQTPTDAPKITDFGLAKVIDSTSDLTKSGMIVGTLAYMAPEQAGGRPNDVGPGSDIYALGVILYELLTGRTPFRSSDTLGLLTQILSDDPLPLRTVRDDVPRDLETICLKCLRKSPAARYASAQELSDDLELFLRGEPIRATRSGPIERLFQWARRRPIPAVTYVVSLLFYALHLVSKWILESPTHQGNFHWFVTGMLLGYCAAVTGLQRWLDNPRLRVRGLYAYAALSTLVLTVGNAADSGPRSAPVGLFAVLIAASVMLHPRPAMIWFQTGLSVAAYSWLTAYAHWFRPEFAVGIENAVGFTCCLLMMGMVMHLTLRRLDSTKVK